MSSMDKMWASLIAIGLMFVATALITFARAKTKGLLRFLLSLAAFLLIIPILFLSIVSIF
jgi:putative flippase GtrA